MDQPATGIIVVDHGSRRAESNELLERVAVAFATRYASEFAIVEPAHMELAMPDIAAAYAACVRRGARRVVVLPFFLGEGKHWTRDIPSLTSQAAERFPGTEYQVARPLGLDDLMLELLRKRALENDQPVIAAGEADARLGDTSPARRRVQCNTCPFAVRADGTIIVRPESGVDVMELASRPGAVA